MCVLESPRAYSSDLHVIQMSRIISILSYAAVITLVRMHVLFHVRQVCDTSKMTCMTRQENISIEHHTHIVECVKIDTASHLIR